MKKVMLGELEVSALGLGCMGMSQSYGKPDIPECERTLHRALELGVTFFDTANVYGGGENETLVGRVLKDKRQEFVLASKFGIVRKEDGTRGVDGDPRNVSRYCEESLKRLRTDMIDLYYLHRPDPEFPIEETGGAMSELIEAGKERYLGLSEISAKNLRAACATHKITAVQSEYSLWTRDPENSVLEACRELDVGFVPFSPLGRGMLTGRITSTDSFSKNDLRIDMPRFSGDNFPKNLELVERLESFASDRDATAGQISLAWLLQKGENIAPIPGTKRVDYLEEDIGSVELDLPEEDVQTLEGIFYQGSVAGERYPPSLMAAVDKEV